MEACMIKPEVKKKPIKPKPPPKPAQIKRNDPERPEKPAPEVPPRPTHTASPASYLPKPPPKPAQIKINDPETPEIPPPFIPPRPTDAPKPPPKPAQIKRSDPEGLKKAAPVLPPRPTDADPQSLNGDVSGSNDDHSEHSKEKGGFFRFQIWKTSKAPGARTPGQDKELLQTQLSVSNGDLSENNNSKATESLDSELSDTTDNLSENKFHDGELTTSSEALSESKPKERGRIFSAIFKKSPKPAETTEPDENESPDTELLISDDLTENTQEKGGGLFSGLLKKTLKVSLDREAENEPLRSRDELSESNTSKEKNIFSNVFKSLQKPAKGSAEVKEQEVNCENQFSSSSENLNDTADEVKVKRRGLAGLFQRSASNDNLCDEESNTSEEKKLSGSWENLLGAAISKEKTARLTGIFKKSPKPAPRSITSESTSSDSLGNAAEEDLLADSEISVGDNLPDTSSQAKEKKVRFAGMFKKAVKTVQQQKSEDVEAPEEDELGHRRTIKRKRRVVSFRVKKTLPTMPKITVSSQTSDKLPVMEENVELHELNSPQESTIEVQPVEMAAYPTENNLLESDQENDELMEWWNSVKGWTEWNETSHFQEEDEEMAVEQAADRVYLAARLFVHLFNQRGASLQHRILELLSLADGADQFHKKTVSAAVGGGVASVAGSVATITGLILAPFTFGASVIVTAVGISVATAGGITSATANITDTVHSRMDRKKVEKMIQGYQEEIKDIRECLEFVQEGMDTLQEWDFEQYSQSAATKALNHSVKHVVREGGRAGKDLMINTTTLISTVQLLGATGGAVKAAQVISVTTGVMSGLFLALDVFFLAKDSHELRKGAKTQFAAKVREVCKELQDGLLELNKVKTQLQKTMDGIEVEEYEEEVMEIEEDLEWDPKKLAELEQELDLLEEKLDKKVEEEQKKSKEGEKENQKSKEKKKKSTKYGGDPQIMEKEKEGKKEKDEVEGKLKERPEEDKEMKTETSVKAAIEVLKEQVQKKGKKDKETKKQKEKCEHEKDKAKKDAGTKEKTRTEKKVDVKEQREQDDKSTKVDSERWKIERETQRREEMRGRKPDWKPVNTEKEEGSGRIWRKSSRSDSERGSKCELRESDKEKGNSSREMERLGGGATNGTESWRKTEEERAAEDRRAEMARSREQTEMNEGRDSREPERGDERRGSETESKRRQPERKEAEETEKGRRREDGESRRRHREREHTRRGRRPQSSALLGDGLYI
ncbi:uncharacterized protein LOC113171725 isoform X2 [Anabas testudineus]|uniref:uncharacterized protein LOC113171725 isoform X2 n=1 Tax=Anabas testudineus TaxID=64144 RepID=UPI000E45C5B5|nr:uncharacterized protein LOC113171725 isoform X2 [Anabas testudineus]